MNFEVVKLNSAQTIRVDESWIKLLRYVQQHPFTEMKIAFRDGKPFIAEEVKENLKFS